MKEEIGLFISSKKNKKTYHYSKNGDNIKSFDKYNDNLEIFDSIGLHSGSIDTVNFLFDKWSNSENSGGVVYPLEIKIGKQLLNENGSIKTEKEVFDYLNNVAETISKETGLLLYSNSIKVLIRNYIWNLYDSIPYVNGFEDKGNISYISPAKNIKAILSENLFWEQDSFVNKSILNSMTNEELLEKSYHNVPIENIMKISSPFSSWMDIESPITKEEVFDCIKNNEAELIDTPLTFDNLNNEEIVRILRKKHIKKIAYFVINKPKNPISIDIGFPEYKINTNHIIDDGNHRLAGEFLSGNKFIKTTIHGDDNYAKSLDIFYPNDYFTEFSDRYSSEYLVILDSRYNDFLNKLNKKEFKKDGENIKININHTDFSEYCKILECYIDTLDDLNEQQIIFKNLTIDSVFSSNLNFNYYIVLSTEHYNSLFNINEKVNKKNKLKI